LTQKKKTSCRSWKAGTRSRTFLWDEYWPWNRAQTGKSVLILTRLGDVTLMTSSWWGPTSNWSVGCQSVPHPNNTTRFSFLGGFSKQTEDEKRVGASEGQAVVNPSHGGGGWPANSTEKIGSSQKRTTRELKGFNKEEFQEKKSGKRGSQWSYRKQSLWKRVWRNQQEGQLDQDYLGPREDH